MATANTLTSDRPVNGSVVCDGEVVPAAEAVDRVVVGGGVVSVVVAAGATVVAAGAVVVAAGAVVVAAGAAVVAVC